MSRYKYPRTLHAPWSRPHKDDKKHFNMDAFLLREVVVTEKLDGENTTMYNDHYHARSLDSRHHPSRDAVKGVWGSVRYMIPEGWRVCGENMYAEHSIPYSDLESFFYGFSVWDARNVALSWDATLRFFDECGITPVPVLYRGVYNEWLIKGLWDTSKADTMEGYVIRVTDEIAFDDFGTYVAKFVRKGHVQTDEHWMTKAIVPNKLKAK